MTFPRYHMLDEAAVGGIEAACGAHHLRTELTAGEHAFHVARGGIVEVLRRLRDDFHYQQLMEIAGVDYPERGPERFEVVYNLLSLTKNHRLRVHVTADDVNPVPSVTGLWPVAGWLEREVFDMFGVLFDGNPDLRRILTDYGFRGHPFRKDFPMTGYVEMRYSEEAKRVVYEPVSLAQDYRPFDFMSPWEGAEYVLPGDEKAGGSPVQPGAQSPAAAKPAADAATAPPDAGKPAPGAARSVQGLGKPDEVKT